MTTQLKHLLPTLILKYSENRSALGECRTGTLFIPFFVTVYFFP